MSVEASFLLHRRDDKQFVYEHLPALSWSAPLKAWVTADHALIQQIQQSKDFSIVDQKNDIARLQDRLGLNLEHILKVLDHVPACAEGSAHAEKRKSLAIQITQRTEQALSRFRDSCEHLCGVYLSTPDTFDIVDAIFDPLIRQFTRELSGLDLDFRDEDLVPAQLFDGALGPSRREHLNSLVGSIWHEADKTCPAHQRNDAVSLAIFGSDTVLGSLSLSLIEHLSTHHQRKLCEIPWSDKITRTAVPFIERIATKQISLEDQKIEPGQIIRLYLDRYAFHDREHADAFFGTGRHVCLGRMITQEAWRIMCACLSQRQFFMIVNEVKYRDSDYMFLFPEAIHVTTSL